MFIAFYKGIFKLKYVLGLTDMAIPKDTVLYHIFISRILLHITIKLSYLRILTYSKYILRNL